MALALDVAFLPVKGRIACLGFGKVETGQRVYQLSGRFFAMAGVLGFAVLVAIRGPAKTRPPSGLSAACETIGRRRWTGSRTVLYLPMVMGLVGEYCDEATLRKGWGSGCPAGRIQSKSFVDRGLHVSQGQHLLGHCAGR